MLSKIKHECATIVFQLLTKTWLKKWSFNKIAIVVRHDIFNIIKSIKVVVVRFMFANEFDARLKCLTRNEWLFDEFCWFFTLINCIEFEIWNLCLNDVHKLMFINWNRIVFYDWKNCILIDIQLFHLIMLHRNIHSIHDFWSLLWTMFMKRESHLNFEIFNDTREKKSNVII